MSLSLGDGDRCPHSAGEVAGNVTAGQPLPGRWEGELKRLGLTGRNGDSIRPVMSHRASSRLHLRLMLGLRHGVTEIELMVEQPAVCDHERDRYSSGGRHLRRFDAQRVAQRDLDKLAR